MSAQPNHNPAATAAFYVILSDGHTPVGAIGPLETRDLATVVSRAIKRTIPGVFAGVATRRPAKGVPIVSYEEALCGCPAMEALFARAERAAAKLHPKPVTEDGDRRRDQ